MPKFNASRRPIPASLRANDSYTFLMKELERVDQKIYEPLTGTDWPRDMPVITGGGLTESIVAVDVTYGSTGRDQNNLIFDATNDIPVIQADLSQSIARCFNFAEYLSFSVLEREIAIVWNSGLGSGGVRAESRLPPPPSVLVVESHAETHALFAASL